MGAHTVLWLVRKLFRPMRVDCACREIVLADPEIAAVPRFLQILNESLEIMKQTTNPGTFFCRYDTALDMTERIMESSFVEEHIRYAEEINDWLVLETDSIAMEFVDRCKAKGYLRSVQEELFANDTVFSEEAKAYLSAVLAE